mmetsp:Transcript_60069/g.143092  ORF Transcript_60069/g.143092 Transcript_60069/m.143092 type:complete len:359 (+) Transcript_60069:86-1162(+)
MAQEMTVFYQINGGDTNCVEIASNKVVGLLKGTIQGENPSYDVSKMTMYLSEQHFRDHPEQALEVDEMIENVLKKGGTNKSTALYIHYDQPSQPAASGREDQHQVIRELLEPLVGVAEVSGNMTPASVATKRTRRWNNKVFEYYGTKSCIILSGMYPKRARAKPPWLAHSCMKSVFPAVAEHIFHFADRKKADAMDIDVDHVRNGLPLLKHIETLFQDGFLTLRPEAVSEVGLKMKVLVDTDYHDEIIRYEAKSGQKCGMPWPVRACKRDLTFGDLHGRDITFPIGKQPFMRSLYCQALMAHHRKHKLPHPKEVMERYKQDCPTIEKVLFLLGRGSGGGGVQGEEKRAKPPAKRVRRQ